MPQQTSRMTHKANVADTALVAAESTGVAGTPRSGLRPPLIIAKVIIEAINKKKEGNAENYRNVIEHLNTPNMKPMVLKGWIEGLDLCVSHLSAEDDILVGSTLKLPWVDKDSEVVEAYITYLRGLVTAHTYFLRSILQSLVKEFLDPSLTTAMYLNVHAAIKELVSLVPDSLSYLVDELRRSIPFKTKPVAVQEVYVRNALYIITYSPALCETILRLLFNHSISIDVEVPKEMEEEEEVQFEVEGLQPISDARVEVPSSMCLCVRYSKRSVMLNEMADKIDVLMSVMQEFILFICFCDGSLNEERTEELFKIMLKVFDCEVITTHSTSYVQFLLFWMSSFHETLSFQFVNYLWNKFSSMQTPVVFRQAAAGYMASYIARAKFLCVRIAKYLIETMMCWIHSYLDTLSPGNIRADPRVHAPFYSLCQAVFYVFAFRSKALLESADGFDFLRKLNFERLITCPLNPLKFCLSTVTEVFADLMNRHELVFCYTILEQNRRLALPSSSQSFGSSVVNVMDCFFPFDPYNLKRSHKIIEPLYQEWEEEDVGTRSVNEEPSVLTQSCDLASLPTGCSGTSSL